MRTLLHPAGERGIGNYGWLETRYSFSFADWHDPSRMGFGVLRVLNDDHVAPASGFPPHPHRDMEIITIVTEGAVTHEDSAGNRTTVSAGDVQVMSAGAGIVHAEYNRSPDASLALFQLWILPRERGGTPRYVQAAFGFAQAPLGFLPLVTPDGADGTLAVRQDAFIAYARLDQSRPLTYAMRRPGNGAYFFVIEGTVEVAGVRLGARDALGVTDVEEIALAARPSARVLAIEVPMIPPVPGGLHGGT